MRGGHFSFSFIFKSFSIPPPPPVRLASRSLYIHVFICSSSHDVSCLCRSFHHTQRLGEADRFRHRPRAGPCRSNGRNGGWYGPIHVARKTARGGLRTPRGRVGAGLGDDRMCHTGEGGSGGWRRGRVGVGAEVWGGGLGLDWRGGLGLGSGLV